MNRAQRRQAAHAKRHKPNRSQAIYTTKFGLEFESFDTVERLFEQIRNGELRHDQKDGWIIMGLSGEDLHILSAMDGWLKYWHTLAEDHSITYNDAPLRKLSKSLEYQKPLTMREVDEAYAVVKYQRSIYRALPKHVTSAVAHRVKGQIAVDDEIRERMLLPISNALVNSVAVGDPATERSES